ncbi:PPE family protein [Mycobacterium decipiens]|uniref:PPE family protein n=1 Tax=Mycobacterium decipiens TaxID=1430326 RepID=A0A1X2LQD3_9MYCO|nr:PPE family protein [Mycobacterium decipiens]OSC38523.1 hypothetical protein B8W66_20095 [Mycobacterium decipiens]
MFMDFAMLPPEVNSGRMYSGPGPGSLWAAAAAWAQVSAELQSAAENYRTVIGSLTGSLWVGPSAVSMIVAVTPYVEWLTTAAAQTSQTAVQATAAASGFEQAFAMTVPPPTIVANRAQVLSLIATNFFGQNTATIAALETLYAEMWEQDATAMYDYATTSAAARALTPFTSPQQNTNPAGLTAQHAAVARATANAAVADGNWLGNLLEEIGILLIPIAPELTPFFLEAGEIVNAIPFPSIVGDDFTILDGLLAWYTTIGSINNISSMGTGIIGAEKNLGILPDLGSAAASAAPAAADLAPPLLAPLTSMAKALSDGALRGPGEVSAAMRSAGTIGQMSVPSAWKAPTVTTVRAFDATPMTTLPGGDVPAAGMPGLPGMQAAGAGRGGVVPRYGVRLTVMTRPLSGG